MKYTTEQLEAIAAKLREMPPVEKEEAGAQQARGRAHPLQRDRGFAKAWIHA
jgi:hypothetical protein